MLRINNILTAPAHRSVTLFFAIYAFCIYLYLLFYKIFFMHMQIYDILNENIMI